MNQVSWQQARNLLKEAAASSLSKVITLPLEEATGRVLASPLKAPLPLPHYDSSAMDGYAFAGPAPWKILRPAQAQEGENVHRRVLPLASGQATPILTGGLIPPGAVAVIRQERALVDGDYLLPDPRFYQGDTPYPAEGADIRRQGEELAAGSLLLESGVKLTPRHLAALATVGFDSLPVYAQPKIAVAYTGNEVISSGLPGPGEVRDAFSLAFPSLIDDFGAQLVSTQRLPDSLDAVLGWLTSTQADLLLLTGGSSKSRADWLRRALERLGASYLFESVAVRPGHPALAARLDASVNPSSPLVLGLPGNPLAAYTALYSYLPSYLAGLRGQGLEDLPAGRLQADVPGYRKAELRLIPAQLILSPQGVEVRVLPKSQSHMLTSLAQAQGLALIPAEGGRAGQEVAYLPLPL